MPELTIIHNPRCSKSRAALAEAEARGFELRERRYLEPGQALSEAELLELIGKLEDPASSLVRREGVFVDLGLGDDDLASPEQVASLLAEHPALMERPVLVRGDRAIVGRPSERVLAFLDG